MQQAPAPIAAPVADPQAFAARDINAPAHTYRGWSVSFDHPPIPVRDFDWSAASPDYDASYEGPEDGWASSGEIVHGRTRADVIAAIDAFYEDAAVSA